MVGAAVYFFLRRPGTTVTWTETAGEFEIISLLPKDAIPAIDDPEFYDAPAAGEEYAPDELVIGVSIDGDSRAYSTSKLNDHEIVNDTVGGQPIAVTW